MLAHCNLKQNMCLCSKQSSLFSFYALPSGGKSKGVVFHSENTHRRRKDHYSAGLQFNNIGFDHARKIMLLVCTETSQTGDQTNNSSTFPYGESSMVHSLSNIKFFFWGVQNFKNLRWSGRVAWQLAEGEGSYLPNGKLVCLWNYKTVETVLEGQ